MTKVCRRCGWIVTGAPKPCCPGCGLDNDVRPRKDAEGNFHLDLEHWYEDVADVEPVTINEITPNGRSIKLSPGFVFDVRKVPGKEEYIVSNDEVHLALRVPANTVAQKVAEAHLCSLWENSVDIVNRVRLNDRNYRNREIFLSRVP